MKELTDEEDRIIEGILARESQLSEIPIDKVREYLLEAIKQARQDFI